MVKLFILHVSINIKNYKIYKELKLIFTWSIYGQIIIILHNVISKTTINKIVEKGQSEPAPKLHFLMKRNTW